MDEIVQQILTTFGVAGVGIALLMVVIFFAGSKTFESLLKRYEARFDKAEGRVETIFKTTLENNARIDLDLRQRRVNDYTTLWKITRSLPLYPKATDVTYACLKQMSEALRDWYFDGGGMFMSQTAKDKYFGVQKILNQILDGHTQEMTQLITPTDYMDVRDKCSSLRTRLTEELITTKPLLDENRPSEGTE